MQKEKLSLPDKSKLNRESLIVAIVIVSESEIQAIRPEFKASWETEKPDYFSHYLYGLGIDTTRPIERQNNLKHRNRLNEVVNCPRWVGFERQDVEWIESGYASREGIDKFVNSRLLDDVYRMRQMTEDAQAALADRDRYTVIDESCWCDE